MSVKINSTKIIHKGRKFAMFSDNLTSQSGVNFDIEYIKHPGAAVVMPLTKDNKIIMLKQQRRNSA